MTPEPTDVTMVPPTAPTPEEVAHAHAVIAAHREREFAAKLDGLRMFVGNFYKYRNGYGPDEKWWLYAAVDSLDEETGWLKGWTFQAPSGGRFEIETDAILHVNNGAWTPITARKFWQECAAFRADLTSRLTPPESSDAVV